MENIPEVLIYPLKMQPWKYFLKTLSLQSHSQIWPLGQSLPIPDLNEQMIFQVFKCYQNIKDALSKNIYIYIKSYPNKNGSDP